MYLIYRYNDFNWACAFMFIILSKCRVIKSTKYTHEMRITFASFHILQLQKYNLNVCFEIFEYSLREIVSKKCCLQLKRLT